MVLKKLIRNPISLIGLIILLGFILVAILAPVIAPLPEDVLARNPNADPYRIPRYGFASTPTPPVKNILWA